VGYYRYIRWQSPLCLAGKSDRILLLAWVPNMLQFYSTIGWGLLTHVGNHYLARFEPTSSNLQLRG
jgi:hypothetical protein